MPPDTYTVAAPNEVEVARVVTEYKNFNN